MPCWRHIGRCRKLHCRSALQPQFYHTQCIRRPLVASRARAQQSIAHVSMCLALLLLGGFPNEALALSGTSLAAQDKIFWTESLLEKAEPVI